MVPSKGKKSAVGVKELKNRTTQIIRDVREKNAEFVITVDGEAVAVLIPYKTLTAIERKAKRQAALAGIKALAKDISKEWDGKMSAAEAVSEQRRG